MGTLLLLNFGTFAETNKYKAQALSSGFLPSDAMQDNPPGALLVPDGVREVRQVAGVDVVSFHGLTPKVWRGKLDTGTDYAAAFEAWIGKVVSKPVSCVYLTGHHWDDHKSARLSVLSWGDTTAHFHARFDRAANRLWFGIDRKLLAVDTAKLTSTCRLVLGFGCNVGTPINSSKYQTFFGNPPPVVLGWDASVSVPRAKGPSVNERFFEYLDDFARTSGKVPQSDRLEWFYLNEPMELVKAWGHATAKWLSSRARARDQAGELWRFKVTKGVVQPKKV